MKLIDTILGVAIAILVLLLIEGVFWVIGAKDIFNPSSYNLFGWIAQVCAFLGTIAIGIKAANQ